VVFLNNGQGIFQMEQMGLGERGCSVMQVMDCSSSHNSQNMLAMGAIMAIIQQPPFGPFSFKDLSWRIELRQTLQHNKETSTMRKMVYVAHVPWVKVLDFLDGEENRGNVQCKLIWKDYQKNEFLRNPKSNSYYKSMR
jgi:hypothetical protein